MERIGKAARRLLQELDARIADKASEQPQNGSDSFGREKPGAAPERQQAPGSASPEGRKAGGTAATGRMRSGSGNGVGGLFPGGDIEMRPPTTSADTYLNRFTVMTEGQIIDARWIFRRSGRRVPRAAGGPAVILDFAGPLRRSPALEW